MVVYFVSYLTSHFQSERADAALCRLTTLFTWQCKYYFNQMHLGQSDQQDFSTFRLVNCLAILNKEKVEIQPAIQRNFDSFSTDESELYLIQENKHFLNPGNIN